MKLDCIQGEYRVTWSSKFDTGYAARDWCYEQFGTGWGEYEVVEPEKLEDPFWIFTFKRLYHAQWFMLCWNP